MIFQFLAQNIPPLNFEENGVNINLRERKDLIASQTDFATTFEGYLRGLLFLGGLATFFYMLWGGVDWILAGGDSGKIEAARKKITQGVIGLTVLASTFAFFLVVQYFLGLNILTGGAGGPGGTGNGSTTCAGGVAIGATVSDGGAGGYCTGGGAANLKCMAAGAGSGLNYVHFDPVSCISGQPAWDWRGV